MNKDINDSAQALLEAEAKLRTIKAQLDSFDREIALLVNTEATLEESIRWLKRKKVITVAKEYRQIVAELKVVKNRLSILRIDKGNLMRIHDKVKSIREAAHETHRLMIERQSNPKSNVFSLKDRKNGQQR